MTRYLPILGAAFAAGAAFTVGAVRAYDWFHESVNDALRTMGRM